MAGKKPVKRAVAAKKIAPVAKATWQGSFDEDAEVEEAPPQVPVREAPEIDWEQFDLNDKQRRFVEAYLIEPNATRAAIAAKYSKKTAQEQGSRLLSNAKVSRAIAEGRRLRSARVQCDADWVLTNLRDVAERCQQKQQVFDLRGKPVEGAWTFDSKGANRALELIGNHVGMFKQKIEHTGKDGGPIEMAAVPPEERAKRLAELLAKRDKTK